MPNLTAIHTIRPASDVWNPLLAGFAISLLLGLQFTHGQGKSNVEISNSLSTPSPPSVDPSLPKSTTGSSPPTAMLAPKTTSNDEDMPPDSVDASEASPVGNELLSRALDRLDSLHSIQAKIVQQVNMFDQSTFGVGEYRQLNTGQDSLVRIDLRLKVGDQLASMQQISDGRFLWTYTERPRFPKHELARKQPDADNAPTQFIRNLSRIDLDEVQRARHAGMNDLRRAPLSLGQGGLSEILSELDTLFTFATPQAGTLHGVDVWMVSGHWRENMKQVYFGKKTDPGKARQGTAKQVARTSLPGHVPHKVIIALGRADLFPFRFAYRRQVADDPLEGIVVKTNTREMMSIELSEVAFDAKIDQRQFTYHAHDLPVINRTAEYLSHRGLR